MADDPIYTHKGWFGCCPVYFAGLETDAPLVEARHWIYTPLLIFSETFYDFYFAVASMLDPDFEPMWPLTVTGELKHTDADETEGTD